MYYWSRVLLVLTPLLLRVLSNPEQRGQQLLEQATRGVFDEVSSLVREGVEEYQDDAGYTALMYAAAAGRADAVLALIDAGFDISHTATNGERALDLAVRKEHTGVLYDVLEALWKRDVLEYVHVLGLLRKAELLPELVQQCVLALYLSIQNIDIILHGNNEDRYNIYDDILYPTCFLLHTSILISHPLLTSYRCTVGIEYGVDPNVRNDRGFTPLLSACRYTRGLHSYLLLSLLSLLSTRVGSNTSRRSGRC